MNRYISMLLLSWIILGYYLPAPDRASAQQPGAGGSSGGSQAPKPLTVGEVINIGNTLAMIDQRPTGQLDGRGNPVFAAADFKFSGTTRLTFARIAAMSRTVLKDYQDAVAALERQAAKKPVSGGSGGVPAPAPSDDTVTVERQKIFDAPAGVTIPHIKEGDLCLEGPPKQPDCQSKNEIPISTLTVLIPIIDK